MKKILLFSVLLFSISLYSQTFDGFYVTNNNDTVSCKFDAARIIYYKKLDVSALHSPIVVIENGVKKKYKPHQIKSFTLFYNDSTHYTFGSFPEQRRYFVHILVEGRLTLANIYSAHPYDRAYSPQPVLIKDDKIHRITLFNKKRTIGDLTSDSPAFSQEWLNGKYEDSTLEQIVNSYNAGKGR